MQDIPEINLRGLQCPSPLVKLNEEIQSFADGVELEAVADDAAFKLDIEAWCEYTGHALLAVELAGGDVRARIRKNPV